MLSTLSATYAGQAVPEQLEADRFSAAILAAMPRVFSGHAGLEHRLDGVANLIKRLLASRSHVDFDRAARHRHVGSRWRFAAGASDGVGGTRRAFAELRWRLDVRDHRNRRGHGRGRARTVHAWRWRLELHLEAVAAEEVDDATTFETEVRDNVEGVGSGAGLLVETVQLLHARQVALAFLAGGATDPDVVDGLDVVFLHRGREHECI